MTVAAGLVELAGARLRRAAALLGVLVVALGSVVLLSGSPAFACSCMVAEVPQQTKWASEVFVGTVTSVKEDGGPIRGDESVFYDVAVDRVWKGSPDSHVRLETLSHSASCGVAVPKGREVAFFVSPGEGARQINSCGGTTELTPELETQITAALGNPYPAADIPEAPAPGEPVTREEALGGLDAEHDPLMPRATKIALAGAVLAFPAVLLVVVGLRRRRA